MTEQERRDNDRRMDAHMDRLRRMPDGDPFFRELLLDMAIMKERLAEANKELQSISALSFTSCYTDSDGNAVPGLTEKMVLLYNTQVISDGQALDLLRSGKHESDMRVAAMTEKEAFSVLPSMRVDTAKEEGKDGSI